MANNHNIKNGMPIPATITVPQEKWWDGMSIDEYYFADLYSKALKWSVIDMDYTKSQNPVATNIEK